MRDYPNYPSYPSVTAVVREVVKHAGNGVPAKQVADTVGLPYQTFMAQLGRRSGHKLDADLLLPLMQITDCCAPLELMAVEMGGVFVPLPDARHPVWTVQRQCMDSVKRFGDLMQRVAEAMEDGSIDDGERHEILRCGRETQVAILSLLHVVEREAKKQRAPGPMQRIEGPVSRWSAR